MARVLVADNYFDAANSVAMVLELSGHSVRAVYSGDAAHELARQWHPDVVILDLRMRGVSGYRTACDMRLETWTPELLLIALTSQTDAYDRALAAGFDKFFIKPADFVALQQAIAIHASNSKANSIPRSESPSPAA